ncbi:hypothetical protein FXO37_10428 [Capsicum annuum]|nr:hypothetical protein FXO37_10428 [Capsicum annuum]
MGDESSNYSSDKMMGVFLLSAQGNRKIDDDVTHRIGARWMKWKLASELILNPLINVAGSGHLKIVEAALDAVQQLIAYGYLRGEVDPTWGPDAKLLSKLIGFVCKCHDLGDDAVELLVTKSILSAVTSVLIRIHGDSLLQVVRTCYDIYLESKNVVNQTTAKASLVQMLVIVFWRMEADSSTVPWQPTVVAELMEPAEKNDTDGSMSLFVQGFITKVLQDIDGVFNAGTLRVGATPTGAHDEAFETTISTVEAKKGELVDREGERDDDSEVQIWNKLRRDAFLVFRALCKFSLKTPPKEAAADPLLMKGKIVALELLKILLENAGAIFRTSDRYSDARLVASALSFLNVLQLVAMYGAYLEQVSALAAALTNTVKCQYYSHKSYNVDHGNRLRVPIFSYMVSEYRQTHSLRKPTVVVLRFFSCIEIDDLKEKLKMATLVSSSNSSGKKSKSKRRVSCSSQAQVESTFVWDVMIVGGEVSYNEDFVPEDETCYTIIIQKDKKVSSPIRNAFKNTEAGKVVLTIKNSSSKKKRAFYRHKIKKSAI